jgi:hypothetical protein
MRCPADASVSYNGENTLLDASISCPLDSVTQSDFNKGSQLGLCTCDVDVYMEDSGVSRPEQTFGQTPDGSGGGVEAVCTCYVCPTSMNNGFAFYCDSEIVGPCKSMNCMGECNGDSALNFFTDNTEAPTAAPAEDGDAAAHLMASPNMMWLVGLMIACMLRR